MIGIKAWDIYDIKLQYEEIDNLSKVRPALILDEINKIYCILKITGNTKREGLGEYTIELWKEAGLDKKSNIRLEKFFTVSENQIIKKRGVLQLQDREKLIKKLKLFEIANDTKYTKDFIDKLEKRIKYNLITNDNIESDDDTNNPQSSPPYNG